MSLYKRFLPQSRVAASLLLIVLSTFAISAKNSPRATWQPFSPANEKVFNLSDFGALGDGVADDGPALQKALDALADAGGGTLFIPAGSYLVATPVTKDFSSVNPAQVNIQGVPSLTMPAPPQANGHELAAGLDLISQIIPATGEHNSAITLSNIHRLSIEHVGFTGTPSAFTDAYVSLYLSDIDKA